MTGHEHPIDGKLHDDCAMCAEIRRRIPIARAEARADLEARERGDRIAAIDYSRRVEP